MNATLQCLANVKPITHYLLNPNKYSYLYNNNSLCPLTLSYSQVLIGLFLNKLCNGSFSPDNFKNVICAFNPLFKGVQANDAKELIIFLLEIINNELVKLHNKKNNINTNDVVEIAQNIDISNENKIFEYYFKNFKKTNCTVIGKYFCGFIKCISTCQLCGKRVINFNYFNFMVFDLEEIYNYFNLNNNNSMMPFINFEHFFQFLSKEQIFKNNNCQFCNQTTNSKYKEIIYTMPDYLIIVLNRGKGHFFNCNVIIPEKFNASNYVEYKNIFNERYELIGIVSHFGESEKGKHFIAFCKHNIDNKWRCYNDKIVTECNDDYLNKGIPYILFYKRDKDKGNVNIINQQNMNFKNDNNLLNNNLQQNMNINNNINNNMHNNNFNDEIINNMNFHNANNMNFNNNLNVNNDLNNNMNLNMNNVMNFNMNMNNDIDINNNLINNMNINMNNNMNNNINFNNGINFNNINMNNNMNNFHNNMNINNIFSPNMEMNNNIFF